MKENVPAGKADMNTQRPLPPRVQEALGELVGVAQEGLLALSVGVGLGVLAELTEEEVTEVVGPKGRHDPDRSAVRHGHRPGQVTLGGRRVGVQRPRVRTADGSQEIGLSVYQHFADRDPLSRIVLERMLAGVSCRRYGRTQESLGLDVEADARGVSKSAISRTFIERTRQALGELMARRLDDVRLAVLMLDGIDLEGRTNIVALGITSDGVKIPLGLWAGSTENATVATALLADLIERGLDTTQGVLCVIWWLEGAAQGDPRRPRRARTSAALHPSQGAQRLGSPAENATDLGCAGGCAPPGPTPTTIGPWGVWSSLPVSSHAPTQGLQPRCARGWPRRSPSAVFGSPDPSRAPWPRQTRSNR